MGNIKQLWIIWVYILTLHTGIFAGIARKYFVLQEFLFARISSDFRIILLIFDESL